MVVVVVVVVAAVVVVEVVVLHKGFFGRLGLGSQQGKPLGYN